MKDIPWNKIISFFQKKENLSLSNDKELKEWTSDDSNKILYNELHMLWDSVQKEAINYNPDKNDGWRKIQLRIKKKRKYISSTMYRFYQFGIAASFILVIAFSAFLIYNKNDIHQIQYSTLNGKSKITLPDSSFVWIGAHSSCTYTSDFSTENRNLNIHGKAFFNIKKDPKHPFIVKVGDAEITVLGTSFNINETDNNLIVSLLSGSISFKANSPNLIMVKPGQCVNMNKKTGKCAVYETDVEFDALWAQNVLKVENKTLGEVVKYLNQWYGVNILLDESLQNKFQYTFSVNNEQLDEILRMISRINPMEITYDKNKVMIK